MTVDKKAKTKLLLWGFGIGSVCLFFTDWWAWGFVGLICVWYQSSCDGKNFKVKSLYGLVALALLFTTFVVYVISDVPSQNSPTHNNIAQSPAPQQPVQQTKETKTHEEALAEYVGSWRTTTQRSKIDDSQNVIIGLQADEPIQTPYKGMVYPKLMIRCAENKTSMIVSFDMFLNNDETKVTYRIDKEKAKTVWWNVTSDFDSLYIPNPIPLIRQLKDEDQIYIQVTPYGQGTISANFYVHGLLNAIKPIQEACGWK